MSLRFILLWSALVTGAAAAIFALKYEVQVLEERLSYLNAQIVKDQESIHVLRAEWSYLNRPVALEKVAKEHFVLEPIIATRIRAIDQIPVRAPEVSPPATETVPMVNGPVPQEITHQVPPPLPESPEGVARLGMRP